MLRQKKLFLIILLGFLALGGYSVFFQKGEIEKASQANEKQLQKLDDTLKKEEVF
jgi:hypothetical protein